MALPTRFFMVLLYIFVCSWFTTFTVSYDIHMDSDIHCLKSIKASLVEDPHNRLSTSWNFNNNTSDFICYFVGIECWHQNENKVININLSNMGLRGQFPRDIDSCTTITGLNLSNNHLTGPIPRDVSKRLPFISVLDLSDNHLSGEIPSSLASCTYLNVLKLNNNQFTGQIPSEFGQMPRLKTFDVAGNLLSGKVPEFVIANFDPESFANNQGLCGRSLGSCTHETFHVKFQHGFVVGYVVSLVLIQGAAGILYCWRNQPEKKTIKRIMNKGRQRPTTSRRNKNMKISSLEKMIFRMSYAELSMATDNFSKRNIIGRGNMGTVYKAMLPNGWFLAVKRLHNYQQFKRQFACEVMSLGRLRHNNLVPLLGFSIERKERLLVYKYMSNGTLYDQLHPGPGGTKTLEWSLRVKIAIGIARGLAWIHQRCVIQVAHLNLSSKCILLDHKFEPKISNFGDSLSMNPKVSASYGSFIMCSEFWDMGFAKKDVHSFGIILFELITGDDPVQVMNSSDCSQLSLSSSGFYDAVDKSLIGRGFDGEIFHLLRVASNCVQPFPYQRPTMLEVYETLREIGQRYGITDDSEELTQSQSFSATNRAGYIRVETTESQ